MANLLEEAKNKLMGKLCKINSEFTLFETPSQFRSDGTYSAIRLNDKNEQVLVLDVLLLKSLHEGIAAFAVELLTNNQILYTARFPSSPDNSILFGMFEEVI